MTSVILVQHNQIPLTRTAILTFRDHHQSGYEIIVVDNASTQEDPRKLVEEFPEVRFVFSETNAGFSKANNLGAGIAQGDLPFS